MGRSSRRVVSAVLDKASDPAHPHMVGHVDFMDALAAASFLLGGLIPERSGADDRRAAILDRSQLALALRRLVCLMWLGCVLVLASGSF